MKTVKQTLILLVAILLVQSCNSVDELSQVDINTTLVKEVSFTSDANGDFSGSFIIDLADNQDVSEYINKIEAVKINDAKYQIMSFTGTEGTGGVLNINAAGQSFQFVHNDFLSDVQNQTVYNLDDATKLNAIALSIKNTKQLQVSFSGNSTVSEAFDMTIKMTFDVTITAQAL